MSNKSDGLWEINPKEEQDKLFNLIDGLYNSGINLPSIKIVANFTEERLKPGDKIYNCTIITDYELKFTTSESMGVWGIDKIIKLSRIIELIQTEIRNGKIDDLLNG